MTVMTGAQALVRALEELGVTDVFGMPGGAILPFYDPLYASTKIRHILVRLRPWCYQPDYCSR